MKKGILIVGGLLIISGSLLAQDTTQIKLEEKKEEKSFEAGRFVIEGGGGIAAFRTRYYSERIVAGVKVKTDVKINKSSTMYPFQFEYGYRKWYGFGVRFCHSIYNTTNDSITKIKPTETSNDFTLNFQFHVVRTKKLDVPIGINWGLSSLKVKYNDPTEQLAWSRGYNFNITVNPRYYFTKHIGLTLHLGYITYLYNIHYSNKTVANMNAANKLVLAQGSAGGNVGFGLVIKI